MAMPEVDEGPEWCAVCGSVEGVLPCGYCVECEGYDEVDAEEARQEARLLRWEASREEW